MSKNLKTQWRVERRLSKKHKWVKAGLFETRRVARARAFEMRDPHWTGGRLFAGFGFGNTRVVRFISGAKK